MHKVSPPTLRIRNVQCGKLRRPCRDDEQLANNASIFIFTQKQTESSE